MKLIQLHPDDVAWMRRRLLGTFHGLVALTLLSSLLHVSSSVPGQTSGAAPPTQDRAAAPLTASDTESVTASAPRRDVEPNRGGQRQPNPVPPVGWRRTSNGWEHVSDWPAAAPSLNELILSQRAEEPAWARALFRHLRSVSPLAFGLFQLTAVALITAACEVKRFAA